jgi:hypothetical protein
VRDDNDSSAADDRREFLDKSLSVYYETLSPPEPRLERPCLPTGERRGTRVPQRIVDGENCSISGRQRQQARVVVLVSMYNVGAPSAERSSYLEHPWDGRDRSHAARNDEHPDPFAPEAVDQLGSLGGRPSELKGVRAAKHRNVVIDLN